MHTVSFSNRVENVKHLSSGLLILMPVDDYHSSKVSKCPLLKLKSIYQHKEKNTFKSNHIICGILRSMCNNLNTVPGAWVGGCLLL